MHIQYMNPHLTTLQSHEIKQKIASYWNLYLIKPPKQTDMTDPTTQISHPAMAKQGTRQAANMVSNNVQRTIVNASMPSRGDKNAHQER